MSTADTVARNRVQRGSIVGVAGLRDLFRDPVVLIFVDADNVELRRVVNPPVVPRVGENVLLGRAPHTVERVGHDYPEDALERIWVVLRAT